MVRPIKQENTQTELPGFLHTNQLGVGLMSEASTKPNAVFFSIHPELNLELTAKRNHTFGMHKFD
jgi:hypothetical protein